MKLHLAPMRLSLRSKLLMLNAMVVAALISLSLQAWQALQVQQRSQARQVELAEALHLSKQADIVLDALRADVLSSLLIGQVPGLDAFTIRQRVHDDGSSFHASLISLAHIALPDKVGLQIGNSTELAQLYTAQAHQVVQAAAGDRPAAMAMLPAFDKQFKATRDALETQGQGLTELMRAAQQESATEADGSGRSLLWVCGLTILAASAFVAGITVVIRQRLRQLGEVAQAIADGDLNQRSNATGDDELGDLGRAIDKMAAGLGRMIGSMREDAVRASFGKHLADALDMADREQQVTRVAARAMGDIATAVPMELLVADSSQASLSRASQHPTAGAPGCGVASPYDCVAVRRGNVVTFEHSETLNACIHLRERACGAVSAVCVPVTFMGRAIGVLHAAGPVDAPLKAEQVQQLGTLGTQIGMRIGTVRAFAKSQVEASTDGLTGLPNRRTLEQQMRLLSSGDAEFVVVMCDLDHFKLLNDGQGHAAGDAALRVFSDVLRQSLRETDLVGRWGGEEFTFVLVNAQAGAAEEMVGRLRMRLADALKQANSPRFTSSFGIADSAQSRQPDQLVRLADMALYQAKAQGRDRACVAGAHSSHPAHAPAPAKLPGVSVATSVASSAASSAANSAANSATASTRDAAAATDIAEPA